MVLWIKITCWIFIAQLGDKSMPAGKLAAIVFCSVKTELIGLVPGEKEPPSLRHNAVNCEISILSNRHHSTFTIGPK